MSYCKTVIKQNNTLLRLLGLSKSVIQHDKRLSLNFKGTGVLPLFHWNPSILLPNFSMQPMKILNANKHLILLQ